MSADLATLLPTTGPVLAVGDVAGCTRAALGPARDVVVVQEADERGRRPQPPVVVAAAGELPFADASFAAATTVRAHRSAAGGDPGRGLAELHRVVRPGGPIVALPGDGAGHVEQVARSTGPGTLRVRAMRAAEAARVGALTLAAYDRYGTIGGDYREFLADPWRRVDGCRAVLVAEDVPTGEVLGTVSYVVPSDAEWEDRPEPHGDAGFRILAVDPAHEGRGVGSALVDACFARAREAGAARVLITSMSWMHRAHELYRRRYGFVRRPDLDVRFPDGVGIILACDLRDDAASRFPPPGPVPAEPPWYEDVWRR